MKIALMAAASTSETSVNFYQTKQHKNPEQRCLHNRRRENPKSGLLKRLKNIRHPKQVLDYQPVGRRGHGRFLKGLKPA
jgi:hypothetical protein